ncbi:MAG: 50S ribosomal protein L34 [Patescibacteria group bacterium]|nr:50S ribosomal protein L34 [Patescibacteria group bacterium]
MTKRTFKPSIVKKARKQGFRARNSTKKGKLVMKNRFLKGRHRILA